MKRIAILALAVGALLPLAAVPSQAFSGGSFFVTCTFVTRAAIDPIASPGMSPSAHEHMFFGNTGVTKDSNFATLSKGPGTTCSAPNDLSSYWVPTFYMGGKPLIPTSLNVYYVRGSGTVQAFPAGYMAKTYDVVYSCGGRISRTPPNCGGGHPQYNVRFFAPGYPEVHAMYKFDQIHSLVGATLSSDGMAARHGDFFPAWTNNRLTQLVKDCLNAHRTCGRIKS